MSSRSAGRTGPSERVALATRLRRVAAERGVSLATLAETVEVPYGSVRRMASGSLVPRLDHALRIAAALDVDLESLFFLARTRRRRPLGVATPSNAASCRLRSSLSRHLYRRDWSDGELAEDTGLRRERINRIKNGRTSPTILDALLIARALGARVEDVFRLDAS